MKNQTQRPTQLFTRALITASAGTLFALSATSCTNPSLGGLIKPKEDPAKIAGETPKKKRGSLFNRAKGNNAWIDDSVQTTRRDRYTAQAAPAADSSLNFSPAGTPPTQPPGPLTPNTDLELDPDPIISQTPRSRPPANPEAELRLPTTLESDFPQPNMPSDSPDVELYNPRPSVPAIPEDAGYIPLQPRLPLDEPIQTPLD